jgi:hypothetical protein
MKKISLLTLLAALVSCNSYRSQVDFPDFPLEVPVEHSLMAGWEKKIVQDSLLIDDMEQGDRWVLGSSGAEYWSIDYETREGIPGELSYTRDRAKDGARSLRFRTSLRDTALYHRNRTRWNTFDGEWGGFSAVMLSFDTPQDWSAYNRLSFWVYVHPSATPNHCLALRISNQTSNSATLTADVASTGHSSKHVSALTPSSEHRFRDLKSGVWNHVLFEIPHLERNQVTRLSICQELYGHHPAEDGVVTYDIDKMELQRVSSDPYEGWTVSPGKFSFSHIGYRPGDSKIAFTGGNAVKFFHLVDEKGNVVFSGNAGIVEMKNGVFRKLDFSDFREEGIYRLRCGTLESKPFPVNKDIWIQPLLKAINFFFCQRCGYEVPGGHGECHLDWQGFHGDEKRIINGGWHDAGDLSQGYYRTAMSCYAMMCNIESLEKRKDLGELSERMRSELAWGIGWLLKTRFGEGYHMSWSAMRIITDNQIGTVDDVMSPARNVPWENFLGAAVACKASDILKVSEPELAGRARVAAVEDWEAAVASRDVWDRATYQEASWGAISSLLLVEMTGDEKYDEHAIRFGRLLMQCQEQNFVDGIPITGYFYTNTERQRVIHNHHTAFEEAPMIALSMLCHRFPEHEGWMDWYSGVVLHSEFFMKRGSMIAAPYYLLPNSVWKRSEIEALPGNEDYLRQFNDGTPLNQEYVLRTFPIWQDAVFHGCTNIQMSSTWALARASQLRNDPEGMQLAGKQLEWVFGSNPFGQSLMYGEGYDFAPHFAAHLKNQAGSIPVGMDCMSGDDPYWSASNNATCKEIWVEPVNRFLGALSVYASRDQYIPARKKPGKSIHMQTETTGPESGIVNVSITITGRGKHVLKVKTFNARPDFSSREIDLSAGRAERIDLMLEVDDRNKPYVAVIYPAGDPGIREEIVGSTTDASILSEN